jgi:hypothetical protein
MDILHVSRNTDLFQTMVTPFYGRVSLSSPNPFFLVVHTVGDLSVDFRWKRVHLFDHLSCHVLYEKCVEQPVAKVENVQSKPKSKWRPLPLDTVVSLRNTYDANNSSELLT